MTVTSVRKPEGKLGVLIPGMGAVGTAFIAGCLLARRGLTEPVGETTEFGNSGPGKSTKGRTPKVSDFVPFAWLSEFTRLGRKYYQ